MNIPFLDNFRLNEEKEDYNAVIENIDKGVVFRGTNLWVLIFAIFVASLGLNVNSTAVIIGAMLISPLMGPIIGIGAGLAVNDLPLLRKAFSNYLFAAGVALATSTLYFLISPLNDAHSEILARTSPNIYDVLIALFGGLAGIMAVASRQKGNVIPGVAIATALMPPLCTAGYGLATFQLSFFFGSFYLFFINTVFIALATLLTMRFLKFPLHHHSDPKLEKRNQRVVWVLTIVTILPSLYFGYDVVMKERFNKEAARFIAVESHIANDYLLNRVVDSKAKTITLTYGGREISEAEIKAMQEKMKAYNLPGATLEIKQGFAWLADKKATDDRTDQLNAVLKSKDAEISYLQSKYDSAVSQQKVEQQVVAEMKVQWPQMNSGIVQKQLILADSIHLATAYTVALRFQKKISKAEKERLQSWLRVRLNADSVNLILEQ